MEQSVERHVITPVKGICYAPSELVSEDDQLSVCEGLTNESGELQAVQVPTEMLEGLKLTGKLVYIHNYNNVVRYLSYDSEAKKLYVTQKEESADYNFIRVSKELTSSGYEISMTADDYIHFTSVEQKFTYKDAEGKTVTDSIVITYRGKYGDNTFYVPESCIDTLALSGDLIKTSEEGQGDDTQFMVLLPDEEEPGETFYTQYAINYTFKSDIKQITSIGNTIICNTDDDHYFFKYADRQYKLLGTKIPVPNFSFHLSDDYKSIQSSVSVEGMNYWEGTYTGTDFTSMYVRNGSESDFENAITGLYAEIKNMCAKDNKFCMPFFVRGAIELYDGSYAYITNPVLMVPVVKAGVGFAITEYQGGDNPHQFVQVECCAVGRTLLYRQYTDYADYDDLVSNVTLFISNPVDIYKYVESKEYRSGAQCPVFYSYHNQIKNARSHETERDYYYIEDDNKKFIYKLDGVEETLCEIRLSAYTWSGIARYNYGKTASSGIFYDNYCGGLMYDFLQRKSDSDIIDALKNSHIYYKLCDVGYSSGYKSTEEFIHENVLQNITTQTTLPNDDYYGWTDLKFNNMAALNRRLLCYDIKRTIFSGFKQFHNVIPSSSYYQGIDIYVKIETESGDRVVKVDTWDGLVFKVSKQILTEGYWFFYPDSRAKHVWFVYNSKVYYETDLQECSQLNGAFAMSAYPSKEIDVYQSTVTPTTLSQYVIDSPEYVGNYMLQSPVDNPFYFNASSYIRVGSGDILGVAGLTTALSQDAYAISTTLCFTTQGIWALLAGDDGTFKNVPPPFSREVCSNPDSITMTDNMVFFVSKKGLMCIVGTSENAVICVSQQLDGITFDVGGKKIGKKEFLEFIQDCKIAYDYKASCLYLYKENDDIVWIYNIKTQTFSIDKDFFNNNNEVKISTAVADYPDYVIQGTDSKLYTLIGKDEREDDEQSYTGNIESRALKLDGSAYLKSLRRVKKLEMLSGTSTLTLYGSNDLKTWTELKSLQGKPYRFFKYKMSFTNMKATDTFSGLVMDTQVRYTDKPH